MITIKLGEKYLLLYPFKKTSVTMTNIHSLSWLSEAWLSRYESVVQRRTVVAFTLGQPEQKSSSKSRVTGHLTLIMVCTKVVITNMIVVHQVMIWFLGSIHLKHKYLLNYKDHIHLVRILQSCFFFVYYKQTFNDKTVHVMLMSRSVVC